MTACTKTALIAAFAAALHGCAVQRPAASRTTASGASELHERSTHRLSRTPEQAAACIAERARTAGYAPELIPLYGLEAVGVTVKTGFSGNVLAVVSLTRGDAGASAVVTTWTGGVRDRADFVKNMVQGC